MRIFFESFFTAIRFLTVLPVSLFSEKDEEYYAICVQHFVLVGIGIGVAAFAFTSVIADFLPLPITACLGLLFLASISGFLHLDGLADSSDGFLSARPLEKKLKIMHDSRTGAMGVIALIIVLIFKYSALLSVKSDFVPLVIFFMPMAGRLTIIFHMAFLPYARKEGGLGKMFYMKKGWVTPVYSTFLFILAGAIVNPSIMLLALLATIFTAMIIGIWCSKAIGGTTGDTLGASCELTETIVALVISAYLFNL